MSILDKKIYKKVEYYLYNYYKLKKELANKQSDIIDGRTPIEINSGKGTSHHSDLTASKAIKLCDDNITTLEKWINIIEKTINHFKDTEYYRLLTMKYFDKRSNGYILYDISVQKSTFFCWRKDIVMYVYILAVRDGLMDV